VSRSADGYFYDSVGRRRKLSRGAIKAIQVAYADGTKVVDLARQFQVSKTTISAVVYMTPRKLDMGPLKEALEKGD